MVEKVSSNRDLGGKTDEIKHQFLRKKDKNLKKRKI